MGAVRRVRSFVQAAAAAQAGASVIQPNVGRIGDYFTKNPGAIRDPKVPHPASTCLASKTPIHAP